MIISASRRTDIPAFYSDWFINRLKEGFLYVRNPMNYHQVSKVKLTKDVVDCIVFWTKNPKPMLKYLDELKDFCYYFQFTLTPYDKNVEKNLEHKDEIINTFIELSKSIGKDKVIWRYDPIILSEKYTISYHKEKFQYLIKRLAPYTNKCIISFLDIYKNTKENMMHLNINPITYENMKELGEAFALLGEKYKIKIETCGENADLSQVGIFHGRCIDDDLILKILEKKIKVSRDKNQRDDCLCKSSIDIGMYNTCLNSCTYCYANFIKNAAINNFKKHDVNSPFLIGNLTEEDKVTERKMESLILREEKQLSFF